MTCLWGDVHVVGAVAISEGTPNPVVDYDSLSLHGASKGAFLPPHSTWGLSEHQLNRY